MSAASSAALVELLRHCHLLDLSQLEEVEQELAVRFPESWALAQELSKRGWLTAFQADEILQGRGLDLMLGSYVLLEKLGEGGMGQVFKARNWKLGRITALKLIRKERLANPDAIRRFEREAKAVAKLSHDQIVTIYEADEIDGRHFLAMEFVEGIDLAKLVKEQGPRPLPEACGYIRQAALGLQHACERGLVHRDIKPSNLIAAKLPAGGDSAVSKERAPVIKILDLGVARLCEGTEPQSGFSTLTEDGAILGTPDYIAPEQAEDPRQADIRCDLYSLGCTFYYLLTGQVPFPGGTLLQKLDRHRKETPPPIEQ